MWGEGQRRSISGISHSLIPCLNVALSSLIIPGLVHPSFSMLDIILLNTDAFGVVAPKTAFMISHPFMAV